LYKIKSAKLYFTGNNDLRLQKPKQISPSSSETPRLMSPMKYPANFKKKLVFRIERSSIQTMLDISEKKNPKELNLVNMEDLARF
jgi:hypothetical protein